MGVDTKEKLIACNYNLLRPQPSRLPSDHMPNKLTSEFLQLCLALLIQARQNFLQSIIDVSFGLLGVGKATTGSYIVGVGGLEAYPLFASFYAFHLLLCLVHETHDLSHGLAQLGDLEGSMEVVSFACSSI